MKTCGRSVYTDNGLRACALPRDHVGLCLDFSRIGSAVAPPTVASERKARPVYSGVLRYFPKAMLAIAHCSKVGNDQHNPGRELHWDRSKSTDEHDALVRHLLQAGEIDTDGVRHSTKVVWRGLAALEKELEAAEKDSTS